MRAIIIDTETTGLPKPGKVPLERQPKIIEFGAIVVANNDIILEANHLINPGEKLSEKITQITGITDEDLADQPSFKEFMPDLLRLFEGANADVLIAHNAEFDTNLMKFELARLGIEDFPWPAKTICTVQEFKVLMGKWPRLTEAYEFFTGEKLNQTHRALDDCKALYTCCRVSGFLDQL